MKQIVIRTLAVVLAVALIVGLAMVGRTWMEEAQEEAAQEAAAGLAKLPPQLHRYTQEELPQEEPDPNLALLAQMDFGDLQAENPDVIGWLCIPDTELSYPVLQGTDNTFYLNHTWQGKRNAGGTIFMDYTCGADFKNFHTIIYGHRMRNDSMFGTLKYYDSLDFWREHPSVYVVTTESVHRYDIFSAQQAGVKDTLYRLDLEEKHLEDELIRYCLDNSVIDTGLVPTAEDHILTLSTCTEQGGSATRWVVHGFLTQTYQIPEAGSPE